MNYDDASDKEINEKVAIKLGLKPLDDGRTVFILVSGVENTLEIRDYCNNPSDAWPIIIDNSITFNYDTAQVHVSSYFNESIKISANRKRALRAAMIVFLKME